jgi:hypothetical protein
MSTIASCHGKVGPVVYFYYFDYIIFLFSFSFFFPLSNLMRWNGGYIHGGGLVDERDRGPSCCEQFVFYPRDREG